MADEDDVDILGDFSINSCFPESNRELAKKHPSERIHQHEISLHSRTVKQDAKDKIHTQLGSEDVKHDVHLNFMAGVNARVQVFEEDVPCYIHEEILMDSDVPDSIQEVMSMVNTGQPTMSTIAAYSPRGSANVFSNKTNAASKSKFSLLRPDVLNNIGKAKTNSLDIKNVNNVQYYGDELPIGSTESVGGTDDSLDDETISRSGPSVMPKAEKKKSGNHRRKYTSSSSSASSKSKFNISVSMKKKSAKRPKEVQARVKSGRSDSRGDASLSPKLQIVFSSGQALPVSEGEQVIKIVKKKSADSESDVEIDVDSDDNGEPGCHGAAPKTEEKLFENVKPDEKTTLTQRKFEPVRPRQKKINLDGDGGCTIMHTESGDLIEVVPEPRKERTSKRQSIQLFHCKHFSTDKPAPYSVRVLVSALVQMDAHAHGSRAEVMGLLGGELRGAYCTATCVPAPYSVRVLVSALVQMDAHAHGSRAEVMGLLGGELRAGVLHVRAYAPCAAAADHVHCDMCPVSQANAAEALNVAGHSVVGWHHSHPRFVAQPSELDLRTQRSLQEALEHHATPFIALITSQHWPRGRVASHYRCLRVEREGPDDRQVGYQLSTKLIPDVTAACVPRLLARLRDARTQPDQYAVNMAADVCPDAGITYLEKCISSVSQHLTSAGYSEQDLVFKLVIRGIRDIFR